MAKSGTKAGVGRPASAGAAGDPGGPGRGAIAALKEEGFAGASAREIARRAGCNQGLVFYHFGSVANLLLAALDDVSETRHVHYQAAVDRADGIGELVDAAEAVFEEDLDAGHIAVLAEMIAGAIGDARPRPRGRGPDRAVARVHGGRARRRLVRDPVGGRGRAGRGRARGRGAVSRARDAGASRRGPQRRAGPVRPGTPAGRPVRDADRRSGRNAEQKEEP